MTDKPAVLLLSGGLDSTTCAAWALSNGFMPTALSVDYGQRQRIELERARAVAERLGLEHRVIKVDLASIASLADAALEEWCVGSGAGQDAARAAKALAGRAGRRIAQHSLQCFGAIAFTDEHVHHRYSRRIHTLDAVFGSMYALERELGGTLVEGGIAPRCVEVWHPRNCALRS